MGAGVAKKYLVIDMDGTLYPEHKETAVSAALAKRLYGYTEEIGIPDDDVRRLVGRYVRESRITPSIDLICGKYVLDKEEVAEYVFDMHPRRFGISKDRRLLSLLLGLEAGNRLTLFTNSPRIWADRVVSALGLGGVFDSKNTIYYETLDHGASTKPSERAFQIMMKKTTANRGRLVLLDDDLWNVRVAKLMGIRAIRVSDRKRDIYSVLGGLLERQ